MEMEMEMEMETATSPFDFTNTLTLTQWQGGVCTFLPLQCPTRHDDGRLEADEDDKAGKKTHAH